MLPKILLLQVMSIGLITVPIKAQDTLVELPDLYMEDSDKALMNSIWNMAGFPSDQGEPTNVDRTFFERLIQAVPCLSKSSVQRPPVVQEDVYYTRPILPHVNQHNNNDYDDSQSSVQRPPVVQEDVYYTRPILPHVHQHNNNDNDDKQRKSSVIQRIPPVQRPPVQEEVYYTRPILPHVPQHNNKDNDDKQRKSSVQRPPEEEVFYTRPILPHVHQHNNNDHDVIQRPPVQEEVFYTRPILPHVHQHNNKDNDDKQRKSSVQRPPEEEVYYTKPILPHVPQQHNDYDYDSQGNKRIQQAGGSNFGSRAHKEQQRKSSVQRPPEEEVFYTRPILPHVHQHNNNDHDVIQRPPVQEEVFYTRPILPHVHQHNNKDNDDKQRKSSVQRPSEEEVYYTKPILPHVPQQHNDYDYDSQGNKRIQQAGGSNFGSRARTRSTINYKVLPKPPNSELKSSEENDSPILINHRRTLHPEYADLEISDANDKKTNIEYLSIENLEASPQNLETVDLPLERMERMMQFKVADDNIHINKKSKEFLRRNSRQIVDGGRQSPDSTITKVVVLRNA